MKKIQSPFFFTGRIPLCYLLIYMWDLDRDEGKRQAILPVIKNSRQIMGSEICKNKMEDLRSKLEGINSEPSWNFASINVNNLRNYDSKYNK